MVNFEFIIDKIQEVLISFEIKSLYLNFTFYKICLFLFTMKINDIFLYHFCIM